MALFEDHSPCHSSGERFVLLELLFQGSSFPTSKLQQISSALLVQLVLGEKFPKDFLSSCCVKNISGQALWSALFFACVVVWVLKNVLVFSCK